MRTNPYHARLTLLLVVITGLLLVPARFASANLIANGDFETKDFTGWTTIPAASGSGFGVQPGFPPDLTYVAAFGATGVDFDGISQTFATVPGAFYTVTFFYQVATPPSVLDNEFKVLWGGSTIFDNANAISGYGTFTFTEQATGTSTTLEFDGRNRPGFDFLDDVSVTSVPDTGSTFGLLCLALTALFGASRLRSIRLA